MLKKREEEENINAYTNVYGYILAFALNKSEWPFATLAWEVFPPKIPSPPIVTH